MVCLSGLLGLGARCCRLGLQPQGSLCALTPKPPQPAVTPPPNRVAAVTHMPLEINQRQHHQFIPRTAPLIRLSLP